MESANLHQQQQQQQQHQQLQDHQVVVVGSSNSSLASPCFGFAGNNEHANWRSPNFFLNNSSEHASCGEAAPDSSSVTNSMVQDLGFPNWSETTSIDQSANSSHHIDNQHLISNKIKQELSSTSSLDHHHHHHHHTSSNAFPKFSDMLISSPSAASPSEMLLLNTLSPSYKNHMLDHPHQLHHVSAFHHPSSRYPNNNNDDLEGISKGMTTFSQIFPSVNISNLSNNNDKGMTSSDSSSTTMEMNGLQGGLDLFATARFLSQQQSSSSNSHLTELLIKGSSPFRVDHDHDLQQSSDELKLWNSTATNLSSFNNGGDLEAKRSPSYIGEPKPTPQMATSKKPRFESRASCPPLKVRKEKLGDRIAALQQLVAPFGKTDTASVLMEAIGYIKFLQNQVETLSVPYMKLSSNNKSTNQTRMVSDEHCDQNQDSKQNLRSRGLCLVPLSCMSYITTDAGNGGVWPPSDYHSSF